VPVHLCRHRNSTKRTPLRCRMSYAPLYAPNILLNLKPSSPAMHGFNEISHSMSHLSRQCYIKSRLTLRFSSVRSQGALSNILKLLKPRSILKSTLDTVAFFVTSGELDFISPRAALKTIRSHWTFRRNNERKDHRARHEAGPPVYCPQWYGCFT
jgi:hypothetical protein